jgi:predicted porin
MKTRASDSFDWMSTAAGSKGIHKGVAFAGATWDFVKNGYLRVDEQYGYDVFNTFYVDGRVPIVIDAKTLVTLGAQYTKQKSVGKDTLGSFSTYAAGLQAAIAHGPFGGQLYYTQTGKGFDTQNPFGNNASYLDLQQVPFNTAGEKAWGIGGNVNFASLGAPGLTASVIYASSRDRINALTNAAIPDRQETDLRADYAFAKETPLKGLVATLRGSWLHQDGSPTAFQLRAILNYAVPF